MSNTTRIEVAYATPEKQKIITCEVEPGTSICDAIILSKIDQHFPGIDWQHCDYGIFSKVVGPDYELHDGDRIEIYRPLIADPKEVRRQRAKQGLKIKRRGKADA